MPYADITGQTDPDPDRGGQRRQVVAQHGFMLGGRHCEPLWRHRAGRRSIGGDR